MKKDKNELMRLQTLIESDRVNMGDDFISLVESDVEKLLKDYFDFSSAPKLSITKFGDKYKVQLNLVVLRIKNFSVIPNS